MFCTLEEVKAILNEARLHPLACPGGCGTRLLKLAMYGELVWVHVYLESTGPTVATAACPYFKAMLWDDGTVFRPVGGEGEML